MATTTIGAPGVTFPDATVQATAGATGIPVLNVYTTPGTWTKPATVKSIQVTVIGGGGSGGSGIGNSTVGAGGGGGGGGTSIRTYAASTLPASQPYTVGGATATSSFGVAPITVISATGGSSGVGTPTQSNQGGDGGTGSGGTLNVKGSGGGKGLGGTTSYYIVGGSGGSSSFGGGARSVNVGSVGIAGGSYGGGGSGGVSDGSSTVFAGGSGAQGVVIVEEFY